MVKVHFKLNGEPVEVEVEANELLLNTLRKKLRVTSVRYGCGIGECGNCTVLVDGEPMLACLILTIDVDGREVTTVEGLSGDRLTIIQRSFVEEGAIQCGYCTPAFVLMSEYILRENPQPTIDEIREYLKGVLCRCTGYVNVTKAVMRASRSIGGKPDDQD